MTDLPEPAIKLTPKKRHQFGQPVNLFTAQQMREYRNAALEEAAKVCDSLIHYCEVSGVLCAKQIRALKEQK